MFDLASPTTAAIRLARGFPRVLACVLLLVQVGLPLGWLSHELLEAQFDARAEALAAKDHLPPPTDKHDESRCNICQTFAHSQSHSLSTGYSPAILILERAHESAAVLIVALHSERQLPNLNPRAPPFV